MSKTLKELLAEAAAKRQQNINSASTNTKTDAFSDLKSSLSGVKMPPRAPETSPPVSPVGNSQKTGGDFSSHDEPVQQNVQDDNNKGEEDVKSSETSNCPQTVVPTKAAEGDAKASSAAPISEGYTKEEVEDIEDSLNILRDHIDQPEMVKDAIVMVMQKLQDNPNLKQILLPEDLGLCVRALRVSYGRVITKKTEKKATKEKKSKDLDTAMELLADFKFS